jgi:hypothetical protein
MSNQSRSTYQRARLHPASLDALNFLLADVRGALGPFLNVFLVTQEGWSQSAVGMMATVSGLLGLTAQVPAGAAIDATRAKRAVVVTTLAVLAVAAGVIFAWPVFGSVLAANTVMAIVGDVFGPAVAALTLGLFAPLQLPRQMGRNAAFRSCRQRRHCSHCGRDGMVVRAACRVLTRAVIRCVGCGGHVIRTPEAIDHDKARGAKADGKA